MGKKTRAIKVTDKKGDKPWLRRTGDTAIKVSHLEMRKTILIVCEGQSEELYFKSFPVVSCTVKAVSYGQTKEQLVDLTIELMKADKYDQVWSVFDMDINQGEKEISAYDNAITKACINNIKVAYSNDSFELWHCLHFEYFDQKNRRDYYYEYLSKKLDLNYSKVGKERKQCEAMYSILADKGSIDLAIKNAKRLYETQMELPYSQQNPVTLVYQLVELLRENSRK